MRQARLKLKYENKDISASLAAYMLSMTYTDHAHGKADDLRITLEDVDGLWRESWFPEKGATVRGTLLCLDWLQPGVHKSLPLGIFGIDEIEASGPPAVVTLKAMSAFARKPLRQEKRTKDWELTNLAEIARVIAKCHGMAVFYDAEKNVEFNWIDQREESDLTFLSRICRENGFNLKVSEEKLIIYEGRKFDARPAVMTIARNDGRLKNYSFASKSHDVFRACQVAYSDPETKEDTIYTFTPPDPPPCGHVLKINKRVESLAAAEKKAKAELRRVNKDEVTGNLTLFGEPDLLGGINIMMEGFGVFSGKYAVEEASHTTGKGYDTTAKIRKVLSY